MNRKPPGTSGTFARGNAEVYPRALEDAEIKAIDARRSQVNMAASGDITNTVGLALSGGGIRSATFCLGFLQALARGKLLSKIDLLSTVSGGGYTGIFLGGLFVRRGCAETVREELVDPRSSVNSWLRKNGRYLAPNGAGDFLTALAVQVRNWLSVIAALGILTLTLFLLGNCVQAWLRGFHWWDTHTNRLFAMPESWQFWWLSPCFLLVILGALGSGVLIGCFWFVPAGRTRFVTRAPLVIVVVLSILGLVKYSLPPEHAWRA